jgi:16S rRNA (guanine527-N7)-methyltransferase
MERADLPRFDVQGTDQVWQNFVENYQLTPAQYAQFVHYAQLLIEWNAHFNLTAITALPDIITYHFADSLELGKHYPVADCRMFADVGSGAGFPGLALHIKLPQVPVVLIEVSEKKRQFLAAVTRELGLTGVEISGLDWRTFVRQTNYPLDLVCARASLRPDELVHMFKTYSPYRDATLVYWAAEGWVLGAREQAFLAREIPYCVGGRKRVYVCFRNSSAK